MGSSLKRKDFISDQDVRWCPGCGDYSILAQVQRVFPELGIPRENFVIISGIGCSSRFPYYMDTFGMHSIHGRAPAVATGVKLSNPDLSVWVVTGDGDGLSIGGNHLLHALRRNVDLKILLFNNRIYGLTKGQYSPTSEQGKRTKSTPVGSPDFPVNPISIALGAEATFVARAVDTDAKLLQGVLRRAAEHKGAAFVEILQNCNIFNDLAFAKFTERDVRDERTMVMEDGKPLTFAKDTRGIRMNGPRAEIVDITDENRDELVVHDEKQDSLAYTLSRLDYPDYPVPLGVFRSVSRPTYDELMHGQEAASIEKNGRGDLQSLVYGGDTWVVE